MQHDPTKLYAGVAVVDINKDGPSSPDDPAQAKAIVFRQGKEQAALVICDVINVAAVATHAREQAARESGIPLPYVSVSATHTHANTEGADDLPDRVARAVIEAQAAARAVSLETGSASRGDLSFNRRFLMRDGTVMMNPGRLNPEVVRPVGPIDPEIGIVLLRDAAGDRPYASLTSFALHLTGSGEHLKKADYAYWLEQSLRGLLGDRFVSVFGAGCCEDINQADVSRQDYYRVRKRGQFMLQDYVPKEPAGPPQRVNPKITGEALAETIGAAIPQLKRQQPALAMRSEVINVPLATYSDMDLAWAKEAQGQKLAALTPWRVERILDLERLRRRYGEHLPVTVQAFRLAQDTAIVTLPGEVFVELGMAIKAASPFANTLVIELSNDPEHIASVPPRKSFCENHFEVIYSRLECGGGEVMVDAAVRMLRQLSARG